MPEHTKRWSAMFHCYKIQLNTTQNNTVLCAIRNTRISFQFAPKQTLVKHGAFHHSTMAQSHVCQPNLVSGIKYIFHSYATRIRIPIHIRIGTGTGTATICMIKYINATRYAYFNMMLIIAILSLLIFIFTFGFQFSIFFLCVGWCIRYSDNHCIVWKNVLKWQKWFLNPWITYHWTVL